MFDHTGAHREGRAHQDQPHRRRDERFDMGRQLREELRRNLRHHGRGRQDFNFGDIFGGARRGAVVRRGEVRGLILTALLDKPMHGYEVIQELEAQSDGRWRPSAGSIYPTLQQLSDEGLVTGEDIEGRRVFTITDAGRKVDAESADRSPWTESEDSPESDIRKLALQLAAAVMQVQRMGSPRARREADRILNDARKQMYRLLADDENEDASSEDEDVSADDAGHR
jgi:DNA-binding PadR family transcriptional regulator